MCVTIRKTVWIECGFARGQIIVIISPYEFESLNGATNEIIKLLVRLKLTVRHYRRRVCGKAELAKTATNQIKPWKN